METSKKILMVFEGKGNVQRRGWKIDLERSRRKQAGRRCKLEEA